MNPNCEWVSERIEPFLDGELDDGERADLEKHVGSCLRCRREVSRARKVLSELRELPAQRCPDRVVQRVLAEVETQPRLLPSRGFTARVLKRLTPAMVAAAAAFVFAVAVLFAIRDTRRSNELSPERVADAEAALKWTLAYVGDINRRSAEAVKQRAVVDGVVVPVNRAFKDAFDTDKQDPSKTNGGSI